MSQAKSRSSTPKSRQRKKPQPATKAERAAIQFGALEMNFNWSNGEWALRFLPQVRLASETLNRDRKGLGLLLADMNREGMVPDLLDGLIATREHLLRLAKMIDLALDRSYLVLEDLGFTPDNPPADNVVRLRSKA